MDGIPQALVVEIHSTVSTFDSTNTCLLPITSDLSNTHSDIRSLFPMITASHLKNHNHSTQTPKTLSHKRSFITMVESNGVKYVGYERELKEGEHPPSNFETSISPSTLTPPNNSPNYDLNLCIIDLGEPNVGVVAEPVTPDGTPSLVMCGHHVVLNNVTNQHFVVIKVSRPILQGHVTYFIRDLRSERFAYLLVPAKWAAENW